MPFKDPDPTDPNMLVGVMLSADAEATREMAYVFAEEFARLGYTREQLLWLFKNPFYGGAHGAYRALGENETLSIIDECLNVWGSIRIRVQDVQAVQTVQTVSEVDSLIGCRRTSVSFLPRDAGEDKRGGLIGLNGLNVLNSDSNFSPNIEALVDDRQNLVFAERSIGAMGAAVERILKEPKQLLAGIAETGEFFGEYIGHVTRCFSISRQQDAD